MIEAYAIGVSLSLRGNIGSEIAAVARQFENLNRIIASSQTAVNELASGMRGLTRLGRGAADAWKDAAAAMTRAASAMRQAQDAAKNSARTPAPAQSAAASPSTMLRVPAPPAMPLLLPAPRPNFTMWNDPALPTGGGSVPLMGPPRPPPGDSGGPGAGALATIERVGTFAGGPGSQVNSNLPVIPGGGGGAEGGGRGPMSLGGIPWQPPRPERPGTHDMAMAGMGFGALGAALWDFTNNAVKARAEVEHLKSELGRMGFSADQTKEALQRATDLQQGVPGLTIHQGLEIIKDLMAVTQNRDESLKPDLLRAFGQAGVVLNATGKSDAIGELFKAMQSAELKGAFSGDDGKPDVGRAEAFLRNVLNTTMQTAGRVGPSEILQTIKSGGLGAAMAGDKDLFVDMIAPILSMGAARAGTGMQAFAAQFSAGKMSDAAVKLMLRMGLVENLPKEAGTMADQQFAFLKPMFKTGIGQWALPMNMMPYRNSPELNPSEHPVEFMDKVLLPKIDAYNLAHNGAPRDAKDLMAQRMAEALALASRIPSGNLIGDVLRNMPLILRDREAMSEASKRNTGESAFNQLQATDPNVKMQAFSAALNGLMVALGGPIMESAIGAIKDITTALNAISNFAAAHPDITKYAMEATAGIGALSLALAALSGVFLVAPAMWSVTKWLGLSMGLGRLAGGIALLAEGTAAGAAMAAAPKALAALASAIVGFVGKLGAAGFAVHQALAAIDPKDTLGSWVDRHGGAAIDNWFKQHIGVGRSFQEQLEADPEHAHPEIPGQPGHQAPQHQPSPVPPSQNPFLNPASYRPPPVNLDQKLEIHVQGQIDGRTLLSFVSEKMLRAGSGPSGGSTGFDARTVYSGGMQAA